MIELCYAIPFSALTLLHRREEGYLTCKILTPIISKGFLVSDPAPPGVT